MRGIWNNFVPFLVTIVKEKIPTESSWICKAGSQIKIIAFLAYIHTYIFINPLSERLIVKEHIFEGGGCIRELLFTVPLFQFTNFPWLPLVHTLVTWFSRWRRNRKEYSSFYRLKEKIPTESSWICKAGSQIKIIAFLAYIHTYIFINPLSERLIVKEHIFEGGGCIRELLFTVPLFQFTNFPWLPLVHTLVTWFSRWRRNRKEYSSFYRLKKKLKLWCLMLENVRRYS